ncbi:hypothetical protein [Pseudomonas sp. LS-2]|jgi:hypothetical protein|uniref:hypothetical protein n=1 Tax=Pseudomonas sp. LS-2 TaxID=2315859 RepID=UPI000E72B0D2|nr:hypothetical protein [Pseudomonas sp. LS-2]RJX74951.1 hypothetical protein D3M70_26620 [Pseudomonas sp. LS-2]
MGMFTADLPDVVRQQANKILHEIETSGSMIAAVKNSARANGFVLGLQCANLPAAHCEDLADLFDSATEKTLRALALGR